MSFEFRQEIRARLDKIEEMLAFLVSLEQEEDIEETEEDEEGNKTGKNVKFKPDGE